MPWWRRDLSFPRFWRYYPAMVVASVVTSLLASQLWVPLGLVPFAALWGAVVLLWGPRGLARPTACARVAWQRAGLAAVLVLAPFALAYPFL